MTELKRRTFLSTAAITAMAGCAEGTNEGNESKKKVKLLNHEGFRTEYGSVGVKGEVKNVTEDILSYVEVNVQVYDANDNRIGSALANVSDLGPGRVWQFEAVCIDCAVPEVDSYSIQVEATDL